MFGGVALGSALVGLAVAWCAGVPNALASSGGPTPSARQPLSYQIVQAAPQDGGGEPSIIGNGAGELFLTYPAGHGTDFYHSTTGGRTWQHGTNADSASGDDCIFTDQSGALYLCNLAGSKDKVPLQADVFKSLDRGRSWTLAGGTVPGAGASSQPFMVDRPWGDAYVPPGKTTKQAEVVLMYHDFGPSQIWVNISHDGGRTFGAPVDVIAGSPAAEEATFCNSVPTAVRIVKSGRYAGRIYVAWIAADVPTSVATGCNITQLDTFHSVWVAWSDDGGTSWTSHLVYDGGPGTDTSTPFAAFTTDDQGNPYYFFADNLGSQYDVWLEASPNGGISWNGSTTGAGAPYLVDDPTVTHTNIYPTIAVGAPGHVDVAWLASPGRVKTLPYGKFAPAGGAGLRWYLYSARASFDLGAAGTPRFVESRVTPSPMHVGDICNLGIFCVDPSSNRNLLDYIWITLDPHGFAHIAYTDDHNAHGAPGTIDVANQVGGPSAF
jgi:hypothetical protein